MIPLASFVSLACLLLNPCKALNHVFRKFSKKLSAISHISCNKYSRLLRLTTLRTLKLNAKRMRSFFLPLFAELLCVVAAVPEGLVMTPLGPVQGVVTDRARAFIGMPYAAPPVGELRWKPPQPVAQWGPSVYQAINDPPGCPQNCTLPPHTCVYLLVLGRCSPNAIHFLSVYFSAVLEQWPRAAFS